MGFVLSHAGAETVTPAGELDPFQLTDEQKATIKKNSRKWRVKPGPPILTIFVRHASDCKYREDETWKRFDCPKHLRWTHERKQHRASARTRIWAEAERRKREIEDQLSGRAPEVPDEGQRGIQASVDI